jgi:hypothetical protein
VQPVKLTSELLAQGTVIREPVGKEKGYWVGCPGAFYDEVERVWYLTYRIRRPRGVQPDRGGEVRIARSMDLKQWDDVLRITKDQYNSASIERSALHHGRDGLWRYFTSYVDPADGRWCTALMKAAKVEHLDPARREVIFTAAPLGLEGVKDPWVLEADGVYHLFLSIALPTARTNAGSHGTLDIFNTGECVSATGLAVSRDLDKWDWQGVVLKPDATGWDKYCRRINSVIPVAADVRRLQSNAECGMRNLNRASLRRLLRVNAGGSRSTTAARARRRTTRSAARSRCPPTCATGAPSRRPDRSSPARSPPARRATSMRSSPTASGTCSTSSPARTGRMT